MDAQSAMSKVLAQLIDDLHVEKIEMNLFRAHSAHKNHSQVFGGQVLAQALNAASRTLVSAFSLHSAHAYFLRPGDPELPIVYEVDRIRDGKAFATRRVVAIQRGRAIFNMSMSYQLLEAGLEQQVAMPEVPGPEDLISDQVLLNRSIEQAKDFQWPIEFRQVDPINPKAPEPKSNSHYVWFRASGEIADDPSQHQELLAYASDYHILTTTLRAHGYYHWSPEIQLASLDHALWFHRPFRIDEWMLYAQVGISTQSSRGLAQGHIFTRSGALVATVMQEGLIRHKADN